MHLKHAVCAIAGLVVSGAIAGPIPAAQPDANQNEARWTPVVGESQELKHPSFIIDRRGAAPQPDAVDIDLNLRDAQYSKVRREALETELVDVEDAEVVQKRSWPEVGERKMRRNDRRAVVTPGPGPLTRMPKPKSKTNTGKNGKVRWVAVPGINAPVEKQKVRRAVVTASPGPLTRKPKQKPNTNTGERGGAPWVAYPPGGNN